MHAYGSGSSKDQAKALTEGFKKLGIGNKFGSEGQHTVKFDVSYEHHDTKEEAMDAVENSPGDNLMQIDENLSNKELSNFAYYGQQEDAVDYEGDVTVAGGRESNVRDKNSIYHSTGHLLGLCERYPRAHTDLPSQGYENDIMSTNDNPTEVNRQHYLNLSQFAIQNQKSAEKGGGSRTFIYRDRGRVDKPKKKN